MRGAVPDLDPSAPPGPLTLGGEEAEIVAAEAAAAARVLGEPRRADAPRLAEAARPGPFHPSCSASSPRSPPPPSRAVGRGASIGPRERGASRVSCSGRPPVVSCDGASTT